MMMIFLFVGGILSLVLLFVMWWYMEVKIMDMGSALVIILVFVVVSIILYGFTTLMISWLEDRVPKSMVAAELDEKYFIKELFIEFVKAVDDNDVVKQEQLKEIAYNRDIL